MRFVVFGLTISSSWGNGHATPWRGLCRALAARGHDVTFFERDTPYYAAHRDEYSGLFIPGFIDDKSGESVAFYTLLRDPTLKLTYQLTEKMKLETMVQFGLKAQPYRDASQFLPVSATQNQSHHNISM